MGDVHPEFEITDSVGTTVLYAGNVGTSSIQIPAVADKDIEELSIKAADDQPSPRRLEFSYDGVTWHRLRRGCSREEEPRGGIKQVHIRAAGTSPTVDYEIAINYGQK